MRDIVDRVKEEALKKRWTLTDEEVDKIVDEVCR